MPKTTPAISYSLKDRGREHTGKPRNFNIQALFDYVNSEACQETVASRGMVGYYGHWPRIRFGMSPTEGGLDNGKHVPVEPAFITTKLSMTLDGVVEHVAEFLDTASGRLAEKLFTSEKVGGFSSAIDHKNKFYGFDYVMEPNFLGNSYRGVALDDAVGGDVGELTYGDVYAAELEEHSQYMIKLLDNINVERASTNEVIENLRLENEELISSLSKTGTDPSTVLDDAKEDDGHITVSLDSTNQMIKDVDDFEHADLLTVNTPVIKQKPDPLYNKVLGRFRKS